MPTLATLTENDVRSIFGPDAVERAEVHLAAGKIIERDLAGADQILAYWDDSPRAPESELYNTADGIGYRCECKAMRAGRTCDHVVALALAWVRERETFQDLLEADEAKFDSGDESEDGEWEDAPYGGAMAQVLTPAPTTAGRAKPIDAREDYVRLLSLLTLPKLREIAQRRNVVISGNRREPIVEALADALSRPESIAEVWPSLSRPARLLLGTLALIKIENPIYPPHAREAFKLLEGKAAADFDALLEELAGFGLTVSTPYQALEMPRLLPFQLPPDPDFIPAHPDGAKLKPRAAAPAPLDFTLLTTRLLLMLKAGGDRFRARSARQPHPLEKSTFGLQGWPHDPDEIDALARDRRNLNALYGKALRILPSPPLLVDEAFDEVCRSVGGDADRVDFALRLLGAAGLLRAMPGQPLEVNEDGFSAFIGQPPLARALTLFAASAGLNNWTELDRLAALHPHAPQLRHTPGGYDQGYAHLLVQLGAARSLLLSYLRRAPARRWIDFEGFVARARAFRINPGFWPMLGSMWYLDVNDRRPNVATAADWKATYGPFVETVLAGPLAWQSAIELAYRGDRLVAFRLTAFGAHLLGQTQHFDAPRTEQAGGPALALTPEGDLLLRIETAQTDVLNLVTQLGEARRDAPGALIYRPTPAGAARLFEAGWTDEQLIAALEQALGAALPETLAQSIRAWWRNFGTLHLYSDVALVELADDYALAELLAGTALSQYLLYRFSPRLIAIRPDGVEALKADLVKKGYTPKMINEELRMKNG
ncbi:MAG TPA: helicase-associated domain-containing protein [Anaerolineae bacterium]|nr:helicase-associated domain-containing protein [Anaerolineae bacterium]